MIQPGGAANNGVSNSSTLPSNTAKSPATATKSSRFWSRRLGKGDVSKSTRDIFKAADRLSVEGGTFAELKKLDRVVISGPNRDAAKWGEAMEEGNPHGLSPRNLTRTLQPLLEDANTDNCRGFCLVGPCGQATVERTKNGFKVMIHKLNNDNEFVAEKYAELNDEVTLSIMRGLFGKRAASNFFSPGSVSAADMDEPDATDDETDFKVHDLNNADVRYSCHHVIVNADSTANLLRRNSIYESFDEDVFNENAGLTEARNRVDSTSDSVSFEGCDFYTHQPSDICNVHNEVARTERSNSLKLGIPTVKIPRANLRVVGPDGLPPTIWDFSSPEGRENIRKCIEDFDLSQSADFEKINQAQLELEEFQYAHPNSVSEFCMEFVSKNLLQRSNVNNLYEQFLDVEKKNLAQAIRKQNEIASSGAEIDGDAALLQPDSIENTGWLTRVQIAQRIEELTPANTIVERVERLLGKREAFSPSAIKPTAGSTVKSSSSVVNMKGAEFRPDDVLHTFEVQFSPDSPDGTVTTLGTLNGSESKTTPIPGSPSSLQAGTNPSGVRHKITKFENDIEKNKRKAVKNTPPKGTAGIQS